MKNTIKALSIVLAAPLFLTYLFQVDVIKTNNNLISNNDRKPAIVKMVKGEAQAQKNRIN